MPINVNRGVTLRSSIMEISGNYIEKQKVLIRLDNNPQVVIKGIISTTTGNQLEIGFDSTDQNILSLLENNIPVTLSWEYNGEVFSYPCDLLHFDKKTLSLRLAGKERREFKRVECSLLMKYEVVLPEEEEDAKYFVLNEPIGLEQNLREVEKDLGNVENSEEFKLLLKHIYKNFGELSNKLDLILNKLEGRPEKSPFRECHVSNISGAGFVFNDDVELKKGNILKVIFEFAHLQLSSIKCLVEVVRCHEREKRISPKTPKFVYAVKVRLIKEEDREKIIKYVFKRQRELLRARRDNLKIIY